jgi:drug/metabolite transporter (DMT)-like permease
MKGPNASGIAAMSGAMALFVVSDVLMKMASEGADPAQLLAMRNAAIAAVVAAFAVRQRAFAHFGFLRTPRMLVRTACEGAGTYAYLAALAYIPVATALALHMATPMFVLPLAAWLLGERIGPGRIAAVGGGMAGVLLVLRPEAGGVDFWLAVSLGSAVLFALRDTITRGLPQAFPTLLILFSGNLAGIAVGIAAMTGRDWIVPDARTLAFLAGSAVVVGTGMQLMILATRTGSVSVVSPFRYTAVLWAVVAGWLVWGDLPDALTFAGIGLIVASGLYALLADRFSARSPVPPASG